MEEKNPLKDYVWNTGNTFEIMRLLVEGAVTLYDDEASSLFRLGRLHGIQEVSGSIPTFSTSQEKSEPDSGWKRVRISLFLRFCLILASLPSLWKAGLVYDAAKEVLYLMLDITLIHNVPLNIHVFFQ